MMRLGQPGQLGCHGADFGSGVDITDVLVGKARQNGHAPKLGPWKYLRRGFQHLRAAAKMQRD